MQAKRIFTLVVLTVFAVASIALAAEQPKAAAIKSDVTVKNAPKPVLCSDLTGKMTLTKTLSGGTATITMQGTACNNGAADYVGNDPLDAHFMVYTWHPPKTPAQEHDLKTISHTAISKKLKKGECKKFTQVYKIANVTRWGHFVENQTERPASKQFVFRVEKKYPMVAGDTDFSKTEDCNISNNAAEQTIDYMEKK